MDEFYNIKETEINIGLKSEHHLIQISDTHICAYDDLSGEEEKALVRKQEENWISIKAWFAEAYGDPCGEKRNVPMRDAFVKLMDHVCAEAPEALLLTGDTLDYMHGAGERFLKRELERFGGRFLCVPGNHEDEVLDGVWGGVRTLDFDGFSIVSVDTRKKTVTDQALADLKAVVERGVPLIVIMHIPIATAMNVGSLGMFADENDPYYFIMNEEICDGNGKQLIGLMRSDNVKAILCGHVHGWHESEYAEGKMQYCNSAGMIGNLRKITVK